MTISYIDTLWMPWTSAPSPLPLDPRKKGITQGYSHFFSRRGVEKDCLLTLYLQRLGYLSIPTRLCGRSFINLRQNILTSYGDIV